MVICATLSDFGSLATLRKRLQPNDCSVCATLKGGAAQGVAPAHAQLRHLRHPLIGWPRWSGGGSLGVIKSDHSGEPQKQPLANPDGSRSRALAYKFDHVAGARHMQDGQRGSPAAAPPRQNAPTWSAP
jgi:hypothetical protein